MLSSILLCATVAASSASPAKPNVMFILADDLGYNELNFMNNTRGLMTQNLDKLAANGVTLRNYYVGPICSPTRSMLMTGRYTMRLGTQSNVIYWDTPWGVPINETFVGQNMQDAGLSTGMFGKWHLGMFQPRYTPPQRGFDEHMGYFQGCGSAWTHVSACCTAGSPDHDNNFICKPGKWGAKDYRSYDWFKTGPAPNNHTSMPDFSANGTNSAYMIRDATIDFLHRHAESGKPWYLYLPFQNVHSPYTTDQSNYNMYLDANGTDGHVYTAGEVTMFGYLTEMDVAIGKIMDVLDETDQHANTWILFSSDNGAPSAGADVDHPSDDGEYGARNYPSRGWKTQIWEGGTKVAGFISSPLLPASVRGTDFHGMMHVTDWLPTIAALVGADTTRNFALDGHNMLPSITSGGATDTPRTELLYGVNPLADGQAGFPKAALRVGDYKVVCWGYTIAGINGSVVTAPYNGAAGSEFADGCQLYNLVRDARESTNVAKAEPARLIQLLDRLKVLADESVQPQIWTPPYQGPDYFCKDCPLAPVYGPTVPGAPWMPNPTE